MPELSLLLAISALVLIVVTGCFNWWSRKDLESRISELREEMRVNNSATYGLVKHLRYLQSKVNKEGIQREDIRQSLTSADKLVDDGADTLALANELGLSQSEVEVIKHLRPVRLAQKA